MSSFSYEQIKNAVDLYFKYNSKIEKVRRELGYPERHTLKKWVDYYKSTGKYFHSKQRDPSPYSKTQKKIAVDFYIKNPFVKEEEVTHTTGELLQMLSNSFKKSEELIGELKQSLNS